MSNQPPSSKPTAEPAADPSGERIAKRLARAGLCSRRDAERWITEGRVAVNGTVLTSPAIVVAPGDQVVVDGQPLPELEPTRLWRYHKIEGLVTTARDEKGRSTVFSHLPPDMPRVISVGRLDLTTEGLLLLTNDGELARFLELPSTGWPRRYRVRVQGQANPVKLQGLARGVTIEGVKYGPIEVTVDRQQNSNAWLTVTLREGKNREVRRVMESQGLMVNRLIRVAYGPFQLGKLVRDAVEEVPRRVLNDQLQAFFATRPQAGAPAPASTTLSLPSAPSRKPGTTAKPAPARGNHAHHRR
ncbi:MAG: pseudouridine synthase [Azospirillaceae bacterium]|nr:pseudouridine synthase [Azospirillaceae bacterium]